jgi:hypothetical protein
VLKSVTPTEIKKLFGSQRLNYINASGTHSRQSGSDPRCGEQYERRGDDGNRARHANVRDIAAGQAGEDVSQDGAGGDTGPGHYGTLSDDTS